MAGSNLVQSIIRGTEIVEVVSRSEEGMSLNQIAEQVGLKTTTVYNLLRSFCASDWLERDAEGKYFVGPGLLTVVRAGNGSAVLSRAMVILRELHESMKSATLTFSEFTDDGIWCRLRMSPDRPGVVQRRMLQRMLPYSSATGLMFQAFLSKDELIHLESMFPFEEYGIGLWKNHQELDDFLAEIRKKGYATSKSLRTVSLAIALPVNNGCPEEHDLRYALGVSFRDTHAELPVVLKKAQTAVDKLIKFI